MPEGGLSDLIYNSETLFARNLWTNRLKPHSPAGMV